MIISPIIWTEAHFYVAMAVVDFLAIMLLFRVMHVDPEHNTILGAIVAACAINGVAFFVRDLGIIGIMIQIAVIYGALVLVSSGEALKSLAVGLACIGLFGALASFLIPRTPLSAEAIGGFSEIILQGGLQAEPIDEKGANALF